MNSQEVSTISRGRLTQKQVVRFANQLFWYCFLAYLCSYIGRKNFSACLPDMVEDGFLTKTFGGYISAAYMIVYCAGQLINGFLGSRYKPVYMIGVGLFGAAICNLLMGVMSSALPMPVIWAANGLFHSMLWAPIIRVFTDQIPDERRLWAGANIGASCCLGAVLAFAIPAIVLKYSTWRCVFFLSSAILFVSFIVWIIGNRRLREYLKFMGISCRHERTRLFGQTSTVGDGIEQSKPSTRKISVVGIVLASGIWMLFFALLCNGALRDGVESWVPTFLKEQFNISTSLASLISVIVPVVSISGTYTSNWLNNRFIKNELYTAALTFIVASLAVLGIYFTRNTNALVCAIFLSISTAAMWGANHMFLTQLPYHFAKYSLSASATGLFNSVIYLSSAISSGIYGVLADNVGWECLIYVWFASGLVGTVFCCVSGRAWSAKRAITESGKLFR